MNRNQITETAQKNHDELWPNSISKAQKTDPDLIKVFDDFAFEEVINHDAMDTKTRVLLILASSIASQAFSRYKM